MKKTTQPVFILAASPRTGSTWLQRVLTSTGEILVWGENSSLLFSYGDKWSPSEEQDLPYDLNRFRRDRAKMWMAVLSPELRDAFAARKLYVERLYGMTSRREGYGRWGVKETRWNRDVVDFLKWAWPSCYIIFLTRDFRMSFTSRFKKTLNHTEHFSRKDDVNSFCSQWVQQYGTLDEILAEDNLSNMRLVRYENLLSGGDAILRDVCEWCGLESPPDPDQYKVKVSYSGDPDKRNKEILPEDM